MLEADEMLKVRVEMVEGKAELLIANKVQSTSLSFLVELCTESLVPGAVGVLALST